MTANNYDILSIIGKSIINVTNLIVYRSLVNSMYYCSALAEHNMFPSFFRKVMRFLTNMNMLPNHYIFSAVVIMIVRIVSQTHSITLL